MAITQLPRSRYSLALAGRLGRGMPLAPAQTSPARAEGERPRLHQNKSQLPHHLTAKPIDDAFSGERHQFHLACLSWLEPHRGAGGDVEPHAARLLAVELQRRVGLEEMIVRADLD